MKRTLLNHLPACIPSGILPLLTGAQVYDSSCSPEARVYFIDKDEGYYLKRGRAGTLETEARMDAYFHKKGLGAEVLYYGTDEYDWLLTSRVRGEDCTHADYLADPKRLSALLGERLRALHELSAEDCPVQNRMDGYLALVEENYRTGNYDKSSFPDSFGYASAEEAYRVFTEGKHFLRNEVLLHGDYCLPNVMLEDWRFSGFIDLGNGGIGDRHVDLFWGAWTLWFNLKTNDYRDRFLDAYGRDRVDEDILRVIAAAEVFG